MIRSVPEPGEELVEFAESLARIACSGGGPKAIAAHLAAAIDGAVLLEDAEWRHVALAGSAERSVPPTARELVQNGERDGRHIVYRRPSGASPAVVSVALRASGDSLLGHLTVFRASAPNDDAINAIRLAAAAVAVEMSRESGGRNRQRTFWERLIAHAYEDPIEAKDDAASRGIALAPAYVAVAIEAEALEEASADKKRADLRRICTETLRGGGREVVALERNAGFVFLLPAPLEGDAANVRTAATLVPRAVAKAQFGAKIVGGVGRRADAVQAGRTVDDAREAMFIARRLFGGSRVMPYDDLGVYPLLLRGGTSREELQAFADATLAELRAYDEKHQTELVRTLRLYFDVGQNVKTASGELAVHRHTVFYRLRQISEISGYDLDSAHDQLALRTAMAIDALDTRER